MAISTIPGQSRSNARVNTLPLTANTGAAKKKKKPNQLTNKALRSQNQAQLYSQAVAEGRGKQWLLNHPKIAANMGVKKGGKLKNIKNKDVQQIAIDERAQQRSQADEQIRLTNPTQTNLFGTTEQVTYDSAGNPIYTQEMSDTNKQILEQGQGLTTTGQQKAQEALGGFQQFGMTGSPEERARIEEEAYKRLTRNVDRDYNQEFDQMEQRLYNRGIPLDPNNPAYKRGMDALNEKYGTIKENARQNAVVLGKGEAESAFGMGLQGHQQRLGDIGTLSGLGSGLQTGQTAGFQAPNVVALQTPGAQTALGVKQLQNQKSIAELQAATQKEIAGMGMSGGEGEEDDSSGL